MQTGWPEVTDAELGFDPETEESADWAERAGDSQESASDDARELAQKLRETAVLYARSEPCNDSDPRDGLSLTADILEHIANILGRIAGMLESEPEKLAKLATDLGDIETDFEKLWTTTNCAP